ncbi:MAG TPA: hypothetical protein VNZ52_01950, partial [Candidatus Thermoplasmatota archaeon]|nr:hypothetical protein [Candidatus Thermoplasmatota archaeon]
MAMEEVTYEVLVNRWKKEVRSSQLAKLDPSFYTAVDDHIRTLQADFDREYQVNPQSAKAMILQDELRNLSKVRDDLYEVREKKILMAALAAARGSNIDKTPLTRGETDLFEDLERVLREGSHQDFLLADLVQVVP